MKVLVIGATGATGKWAVKKLLARGDEVTALARHPEDVRADGANSTEKLHVKKGEAHDAASIDEAVKGVDAVLVAFGPRSLGKTDVQEALARNLVAAMKKNGVTRVVNLSAWGAGDSLPHAKLLFRIARATILRNIYVDKEKAEAILATSDLDVTNVRPGRLVNSRAKGGVRASIDGLGLKATMTREDLAAFMIDQLANNQWNHASPIIGY